MKVWKILDQRLDSADSALEFAERLLGESRATSEAWKQYGEARRGIDALRLYARERIGQDWDRWRP